MFKNAFCNLLGHSVVKTARKIKLHSLDLFSKFNYEITPEQFYVLDLLIDDDEFSQQNLCEELDKDKSNMTRILSVLSEKGLITKEFSIQNKKRVNNIKITEKGRKIRDEIAPVMQKSRGGYLKGISEDDIYSCLKVLSKIRQNLEEG